MYPNVQFEQAPVKKLHDPTEEAQCTLQRTFGWQPPTEFRRYPELHRLHAPVKGSQKPAVGEQWPSH